MPIATCLNARRGIGGRGVVVHAKEQRILSTGYYKNSVEHKYSYTAVQYKIPAFGWSSTKNHIGVWFINPTIEYLSGGASKQELVCHFDSNDDPDPIILDYWRGTHYGGGATCNISAGENWSKVIGPIFVYCNALADPKDPTKARPRHTCGHGRQSGGAQRVEAKCNRPLAGCFGTGEKREGKMAV